MGENMKLSDSEWQVMNALWRKHPATAREIEQNLPENTKWAYTTIKTLLARLVSKKAVAESKNGNTSVYEPLLEKKQARKSAFRTMINQVFEGALEPMLGLVAEEKKLSEQQRRLLKELLDNEE